jgi:hypothetical protein
MSYPKIRIVAPAEVRQALTSEGDIRSEIAFQNDINRLLAWFEEFPFPLRALAEIEPQAAVLGMAVPTFSRRPK